MNQKELKRTRRHKKMLRLFEQQTKKVSFTFGRFNPPTTGHEKLIKALAAQGGTIMVFPSQTQDPKKNPLPFPKKVAYMKKMFPRYAKNIIVSKARQVFEISNILYDQGYTDVTMVVGSDRVKEFETLLNKYNGKKGTHGFYDFNSINVVSAGDRDPDADDVSGMSASKMRAAAGENDFDSFKKGLPSGFKQGEKLFKDVRDGMGLKEQNWTFEEMLRDAYIRGEIFNINEEVTTTDGIGGKVIRKGTNYVVMETNDGLHKAWITDLIEAKKITKTKQEDDVEDMKGTQPAKYYAKDADGDEMSKSTKVARARHFAKGDSRKPAPGDKNADTKPSQYTKKFKQMYGERAKQAVSQGKVQKLVTAHGLKFKGKVYKEIDMELKKIDNSTEMVTFNIIHPKEIFGNEVKIPFKTLRRGPFMATDTSKINERKLTDTEKDKLKDLEKDIDMKDFIDRYGEEEGKSIYYATLTKIAKKEGLWDNIRKKKERIARGSGEKMRKKGEKGAPTSDQIKRAQGESYEIGKDYFDHTKEVDPYSSPDETNEKSTLKKDKKLPNLMIPKKGKAGVTKFMKRKNIQKLAADVQAEIDEQPEHEITVGDYTTKFFYMCGKSQKVMKKHASKDGAEELTRMQDVFYKMEKEAMDTNGASEEQKKKAEILYDKIITKAEEIGIAKEVDSYMKMHLDSMIKGNPKLGFGRTDLSESFQLDEKIAGLVNKSEKTGVPYGILKKSYDRGMAAWKGGHRPGASQQQWAFARVNSMLTGGKADPDLQAKIKAGGYKKKKKAKKESIEEWYFDNETRQSYMERYGDEWEKNLNNTYERMLLKLSESLYDHMVEQAEYQGKKVKLNDPIRTSENPNKKFKVYVKNEKGKVVVVRFGDPNMSINRDDPGARKNFRARHQCDTNPGPKWKARYWSCFQWRAGSKVDN